MHKSGFPFNFTRTSVRGEDVSPRAARADYAACSDGIHDAPYDGDVGLVAVESDQQLTVADSHHVDVQAAVQTLGLHQDGSPVDTSAHYATSDYTTSDETTADNPIDCITSNDTTSDDTTSDDTTSDDTTCGNTSAHDSNVDEVVVDSSVDCANATDKTANGASSTSDDYDAASRGEDRLFEDGL